MRVASDVGGTFTDLVYFEVDAASGEVSAVRTAKTDTTPPDYEDGVMNSLKKAGVATGDIEFLAHGTTVVINALAERKGVTTGLITTRGFRDVLEIARGNRPALFNFRYAKPKPLVPRYLRREVTERMNYMGEVVTPLALDEIPAIVETFKEEGVEAVAICLLHAYANPDHEVAVFDRVRELWPEKAVVASHQVTREWREYERTNTTVLSAYIHPIAVRYLDNLERKLSADGFTGQAVIMQSNGGVDTIESARGSAITMLESGPASGVLGAGALGRIIDEPNIIALDIGGTTAKCSLIDDGRVRITTEYFIEKTREYAGYPIMVPTVDIVEIGQGGGSIAWMDEDGRLNVGPQSAGAVPGPAAYGRGGTEPTTTDANLLTGRIDPEYFLGGEIKADMGAARDVFERLAGPLAMSVAETARGIIRIANNNMINALKLVSLNRGYDPREFTLVAFGGGGGMHASALAAELNIPKVIVPVNCSVFSAWGMLMSDLRRDYVLTQLSTLDEEATPKVGEAFAGMEKRASADFAGSELGAAREIRFERFGDMRYQGQEHTVRVLFPAGEIDTKTIAKIVETFHKTYEREYTYTLENPVEIVTHHLVALREIGKPRVPTLERTGRTLDEARRGTRLVDYDLHGAHEAVIYERSLLEPGMELDGPAIVEEPDTTVVVFPNDRLSVDNYGNLHLHVGPTKMG